jgi:glutamate synthase (NADPH/NADH) large chain
MIGVPLVKDGSDSQDLSRTMETLICREGFSLFEAMDVLFPPIINEIKAYPENLQDLYTYLREAWGHFAQGPAGIISRFGDEAVFSVDALGLRPLWMLEIDSSYLFSSEPGIISSSEYTNDPKPLAPGEKVGFKWNGETLEVYEQARFQNEVYTRFSDKLNFNESRTRLLPPALGKTVTMNYPDKIHNGQYKAFGWERDHIQLIEQMAEKGVEPIRSLGHDAPLAALNPERKNIADYFKESVAVVTNPAIDRDRETEHFSTRVIIGKRPTLFNKENSETVIELTTPLLLEGKAGYSLSESLDQPSFDQVVHHFQEQKLVTFISTTFKKEEKLELALERLANEAVQAVQAGKTLLVLDDAKAHQEDSYWIDPHLVTSAIDQALVKAEIRRDCSLVLRSGAIRSLHDIITAFGLGADLISPYYMFLTVQDETTKPLTNLYSALTKGLEKVISTIGIHELRGYGRLFSSIGLHEEIASLLNIVNFFGSKELGTDFEAMKMDALSRAEDYHNEKERIGKTFHLFPRIWKAIGEVAATGDYSSYRDKISEQETENPTTIRHLVQLKKRSRVPVRSGRILDG